MLFDSELGKPAGTTWLANQLEKASFFSNVGIKEFHVFNKLFTKNKTANNKSKLAKQAYINRHIKRRLKQDKDLLISQRVLMRLSPATYFDFFDYLYLRQPDVSHVGDITPAYSTLSIDRFSLIREGLAEKKFQPKIIFLMRDPVERVWSQLRMNNRFKFERTKVKATPQQEFKQLQNFYKSKSCINRTQYEIISKKLESVFNPEEIYYGFYETLFTQAEINRLTNFLECPMMTTDFGEIVHASPKSQTELHGLNELLQNIRQFYAPTYTWARDRFADAVPDAWGD